MIPILTIAGSDCSGGAGIQADLKTFSAHGLFGMSAIVSVVAENTARVISVENVSVQGVNDQLDAVFEDIVPAAVKVGMLPTPAIMRAVCKKLNTYDAKNVVIDPVMVAKNGAPLMDLENIEVLRRTVIPAADLLTPNIPEAEVITGMRITSVDAMKRAAEAIAASGAKNVLVKGGHHVGDATDVLYAAGKFHTFTTERIDTKNTHGTGCTLSSAIASNLALGKTMPQAVAAAKDYITGAIRHALALGKGCGPTNHFFALYDKAGLHEY